MESYYRKDKVPYLGFFFSMALWGFSSFISSDMINIITHGFNANSLYVEVFYCVFILSTIIYFFLRIGAIAALMAIVNFNLLLNIILTGLTLFSIDKPLYYYILFGLGAHFNALNLFASLSLATHNSIGLRGLIFGVTTSFFLGFIFVYNIYNPKALPVEYNVIIKKSFALMRFVSSVLSFEFFGTTLQNRFSYEYYDFINKFKGDELDECMCSGGKNIRELFKEVFLSVFNFKNMGSIIKEALKMETNTSPIFPKISSIKLPKVTSLIIFMLVSVTNSLLLPSLSPSKVLSKFVIGEFLSTEYFSTFIGMIAALFTFKRGKRYHICILTLYPIYFIMSLIIFLGTTTFYFKFYTYPKFIKCVILFSGLSGSWIFVTSLLQFTTDMLSFDCKNEGKCCEYDSLKCFCSGRLRDVKCSNGAESVQSSNSIIWIPWNNEKVYRSWLYGDCIYCTSQEYETTGSGGTESKSGNGSSGGQNGTQSGSGQNGGQKVYLLRNCSVTACPYCDLNVLLECVEIKGGNGNGKCSCSKKDIKTTGKASVKLNLQGKGYELRASGNSADASAIKGLLSCQCGTKDNACCCCTMECGKRCGKHFKLTNYLTSSCCHYDLKILLSYKELNTHFAIGQLPFPNKFDEIGCLVFCSCCSNTNMNCGIVKISKCAKVKADNGAITSSTSSDTSCGTNFSAIKVVPCNLPYHFREKDITRSEIVSLVISSIFLLCLIKSLLLLTSIPTMDSSIDFSVPFKHMKNLGAETIGIIKFKYGSDLEYAKSVAPTFNGTESELMDYVSDIDKRRMRAEFNIANSIMGEGELAELDTWIQKEIKNAIELHDGVSNHIQYIAQFTKCLRRFLMKYSMHMSKLISDYLSEQDEKGVWGTEWEHFGSRYIKHVEIEVSQATVLLNLGFYRSSPKLQRELSYMHSKTWDSINKRTKELQVITKNMKVLEDSLSAATTEVENFNRLLRLWDYRAIVLKKLTRDGTVLLNWDQFLATFDKIILWKKQFISLYFEAVKSCK